MTKPEKTLTETTRLHMHDHHANSQSKVKVKIGKKYAKSITILWQRIVINFSFTISVSLLRWNTNYKLSEEIRCL